MAQNITLSSTQLGAPTATAEKRGLSIVAVVRTWVARRKDRVVLRTLPDHLLRDIGLTSDEARIEGEKPFWRA